MRIGVVCYPTYGGSGVVATELGIEMASLGHDVHFITYSKPVRLDLSLPRIHFHEVVVRDYPLFDYSPYELMLTSTLTQVVKEQNLDILHVHYAIPHASAAFMTKQILRSQGIQLPIVCTLHGTDITLLGKDASFEPVITFAINNSDAVTAVSASLKNDTLDTFQVTNPIQVIPNFINLERYQVEANRAFKQQLCPNGERLIIHVSNFRKVKRVDDVIKVFASIYEEVNAKLLLIGDGPERYNIELLCRSLGCFEDVHFYGKNSSIEPLLKMGDLFLLPSKTESFGLAALEAMAARVPVISTNAGGLSEVNEHGVSGFLSNVGDVQDMAKHATYILNSDERLDQFKKQAYEQATKFDIHRILPSYITLYESLI